MTKKLDAKMATRCELALMGKVVQCSDDEVQAMTEYILSAVGKSKARINVLKDHINKYGDLNSVKHIVCNTIMGSMQCITYLLESKSDDEEERYPAPFETDYGTGKLCAFCYVLNLDADDCSEFGDCFFEKKADGFYHRIS